MFRSPISLASVCTSLRNSSRRLISSADNDAARETLLPGILTPNHQSNPNTRTTAPVIRTKISSARRNISPDLFPGKTPAKSKEQDRLDDENHQMRPISGKLA